MLRQIAKRARVRRWMLPTVLLLAIVLGLDTAKLPALVWAQEGSPVSGVGDANLSGRLVDPLGEPIHDAEVAAVVNGDEEPLAHTTSQVDGSFLLDLPDGEFDEVMVTIERSHFQPIELYLGPAQLAQLGACGSVRLDDVEMERRITPGFWVATLSFVLVLGLIALERLHKTTAALLGAALVLGVSFVGGALNPNLFIFDFERALEYVDFDVIFLVMGMMIVIAVIEETGIFQWMAYQAYRLSRGKLWLLVTILIVITAVASA